ncbi:MAG: hypothetical protein KDK99_08515 [Verrucomicrobiales bacterium]|nr:hypothetical protein [Verrucomicrobiales bacterium]
MKRKAPRRTWTAAGPFVALLLLAGCAAERNEQEAMSEGMAKRMLKPDMEKRSGFESSLVTSGKDTGSYLTRMGYKTDTLGMKKYRRPDQMKQSSFSGADDRSTLGKQAFSRRGEKASGLDRTFQTSSAQVGKERSSEQGRMFSTGDTNFRTRPVWDAAKSQAENKRPTIINPDPRDMAPEKAWSEDEVRRMLNRN